MFLKRNSIEDIVQSSEFRDLLEKVATTAVESTINKLKYKRPTETEEYLSLKTERDQIKKSLSELTEYSQKLEIATNDAKKRLEHCKDEIHKQELSTKILSKNFEYEKGQKEALSQELESIKNKLQEIENSQEEGKFSRHRDVYTQLTQRLFLVLTENDEEMNLETFILVSSRWDSFMSLYRNFAKAIKTKKRPWNEFEKNCLNVFLDSYNKPHKNKANFDYPKTGEEYNPELHERIGSKGGSIVSSVLLPGIINNKGNLTKKSYVITADKNQNTLEF